MEQQLRTKQLLEEKISTSEDGTAYLNDTDIRTIIEAAQEEDAGKTTVKDQPQVGTNPDLKIKEENPLKRMQSVVAVACKVIRIFYTT